MKWAAMMWVSGSISAACLLVAPSVVHAAEDPPARVGFQLGVRTGYSLAMGETVDGEDMSDVYSGQVPIFLDIGGKVIPNLFIGGYFGLGFGGPAFLVTAGYDYQYFYRIPKHMHNVSVTLRIGWRDL